jgi:putative transcriptional regulator
MPRAKIFLSGAFAGVLLALATTAFGQTAAPETAPDAASLKGQLLVASPDMGDPRFDHTVILMIQHDKDGAIGVVINQPVAERDIADLLLAIDQPDSSVEGKVHVVAGGPVQRGVGFVLHSVDYHRTETVALGSGIAVTSSADILRDIGHHRGPDKVLVAFGYAGWGPGQLEREIGERAWATTNADPKLIFDSEREQIWDIAWARRSLNL